MELKIMGLRGYKVMELQVDKVMGLLGYRVMVYRLKKNIWLKRSKFRGLNVKSVFLIQI